MSKRSRKELEARIAEAVSIAAQYAPVEKTIEQMVRVFLGENYEVWVTTKNSYRKTLEKILEESDEES